MSTLTLSKVAFEYDANIGGLETPSTTETLGYRIEPPVYLSGHAVSFLKIARETNEGAVSWDRTLRGIPLTSKGTIDQRRTGTTYVYVDSRKDLETIMALIPEYGLHGAAGPQVIRFTRDEVEAALGGRILRMEADCAELARQLAERKAEG